MLYCWAELSSLTVSSDPVDQSSTKTHSVGKVLLLKVMHYNVALLPKKVTNYDT